MARTYYNAGKLGRDYCRLVVENAGEYLSVYSVGDTIGPLLNREQVRDLRDRLTVWLGDTSHPGPTPMMEGDL